MTKQNKPQRGGRREGSGRPSQGFSKTIRARVTPEQQAKYERLGGSEWWRESIDEAEEPRGEEQK